MSALLNYQLTRYHGPPNKLNCITEQITDRLTKACEALTIFVLVSEKI